jgi:hypothetical protein
MNNKKVIPVGTIWRLQSMNSQLIRTMRYSKLKQVTATTGVSALIGARFSSTSHAEPSKVTYDLLVVGGGSGGIACGKI